MSVEPWNFLKESDTSLGLFYPLHYIVAGYPDMQAAEDAEAAFREAGTAADDVRAASGEFVASHLESRDESGWLEQAKASLVDFMGTETGYLREDKSHALDGGAFLFVYAPDDGSKDKAKWLFIKNAPVYARRYLRIAIEVIVRNPNAM